MNLKMLADVCIKICLLEIFTRLFFFPVYGSLSLQITESSYLFAMIEWILIYWLSRIVNSLNEIILFSLPFILYYEKGVTPSVALQCMKVFTTLIPLPSKTQMCRLCGFLSALEINILITFLIWKLSLSNVFSNIDLSIILLMLTIALAGQFIVSKSASLFVVIVFITFLVIFNSGNEARFSIVEHDLCHDTYTAIIDDFHLNARLMRVDNSIIGGKYLSTNESIYSCFHLLEAVLLIKGVETNSLLQM